MEYKEYIDSWIHEVKTPITAIQLMCDNERNTVTDRIKLETKKVEMDIERMLYYSKSGEIWKDYVIARHLLRNIVEDSIMKVYQIFIYNGVKIDMQVEKETVFTDENWSSFIIRKERKYQKWAIATVNLLLLQMLVSVPASHPVNP